MTKRKPKATIAPNFHQTIIKSAEWRSWEKEVARRINKYEKNDLWELVTQPVFDTDESRECDMLSTQHWKAFVEFIRNKE